MQKPTFAQHHHFCSLSMASSRTTPIHISQQEESPPMTLILGDAIHFTFQALSPALQAHFSWSYHGSARSGPALNTILQKPFALSMRSKKNGKNQKWMIYILLYHYVTIKVLKVFVEATENL